MPFLAVCIVTTLGQYPPAKGCHALLNRWCSSHCPRPGVKGDGNPLLARKITPVTTTGGLVVAWGCFPQVELEGTGPPNFARLRRGAKTGYCGALSNLTVGHASLTEEQRQLKAALHSPLCSHEKQLYAQKASQRQDAANRFAEAARLRSLSTLRTAATKPLVTFRSRPPNASYGDLGRVVARAAACARSAYATVLTVSPRGVRGNTFMARLGDGTEASEDTSDSTYIQKQLAMQAGLVLTLVQSVRNVERCRRDYVVLLGRALELPPSISDAFNQLDVTIHRIDTLEPSVPPLDKLHAFRLLDCTRFAYLPPSLLCE